MTDLADFLRDRKQDTEIWCPAARLVNHIKDENPIVAEQLLHSVEDPDVPVTMLHRALRAAGYSIARDSLTNHRRRECVCSSKQKESK